MGKIVRFSSNFPSYTHFTHRINQIDHMGCLGRWLWYNRRMSNAQSSKTILAGLLATENLSVTHSPEAETASFDLKNRVLTLPVWQDMSNSLYDMLVGHEVAHALHTPCDGWKDNIEELASMHGLSYALVQQYVNVVEDARIERMIKRQFPGLRRDFLNAYVDLMNRDLFNLEGRSMGDLSVIDRLNLEFKVGIHAGETIPFAPAELQWIDRIKVADTFTDVLDIVNDLLASIIDDNEEENEEESTESESGDGEGEGSPESSDDSDDDSGEDQQQGSGSAGDDGPEDGADAGSSPDGSGDDESTEGTGKNVPESITENAFSKVSDSLRDSNKTGYGSEELTLERVDIEKHIIDYKPFHRRLHESMKQTAAKEFSDRECRQFILRSKPTVNVLVKQFEMKKQADAHKRVQIAKSGVLDTVKMMNYKWSEDVFRKNATVREGKNHGLVMFLDWSGSMCDQIEETMGQLIQLVLFCKKVNIPFEVYAFTSSMPHEFDDNRTETSDNDAYATTDYRFALMNLFSSRMKKNEFEAAIPQCFALARSQNWGRTAGPTITVGREFQLGGTPLNEALLAAIDIVPSFKKNNNVQIVNTVFLTDGSGNGMHVPYNGTLKIKGDRIGVQVNEQNVTNLLTKMLQDRTGSKVVNFFLADWTPNKFERSAWSYFRSTEKMHLGLATWKSDNFAIATTDDMGWDEQYLVRTVKVDNSDAMDQVQDTDSVAKKKNAFLKSMKGRSTSRVVLNRFISLIA